MEAYLAEVQAKAANFLPVAEALDVLLSQNVDSKIAAELAAALVGLLAEITTALDTVNLPKVKQ